MAKNIHVHVHTKDASIIGAESALKNIRQASSEIARVRGGNILSGSEDDRLIKCANLLKQAEQLIS